MGIQERVASALDHAWQVNQSHVAWKAEIPDSLEGAVDRILATGSAPNRQYLLTIAAGTWCDPTSNPFSLQLPAGVDRRGQAGRVRQALAVFRADKGLTLKISQDAGVSNQWREVEIGPQWVQGRRPQDRQWASAFLEITTWLDAANGSEREERARLLLRFVAVKLVAIAVNSALDYPKFGATPRLAMTLVKRFLAAAPDKPDAHETVVAVAARVLTRAINPEFYVGRGDVNSPDPIDVQIVDTSGEANSGIEVTIDKISLGKLQHEVVPAMLKLGLDRATVVSAGVLESEASDIEAYVARAYTHFQQRIDLVTVDVIEAWLTFPAAPSTLAVDFLWGVGSELDQFSTDGNRRAWFDVLNCYASSVDPA